MAIFSFNSCRFALVLAAACSAATTAKEEQLNNGALRGNERKLSPPSDPPTSERQGNRAIQETLAVQGGALVFGLPASTIAYGNVCADTAITGVAGTNFNFQNSGELVTECNPTEPGFFGELHGAALAKASTPLPFGEIGTLTLRPGVWSSASINIAANTVVTLSGAGSYIFLSGSTLVTGANSIVNLVSGATPEDVLWVTTGAVTTGANSKLAGSVMSGAAITLGAITEVTGVVLAKAAVTVGGTCSLNTGNVFGDKFPDATFIADARLPA
jgi:hypothetical protein